MEGLNSSTTMRQRHRTWPSTSLHSLLLSRTPAGPSGPRPSRDRDRRSCSWRGPCGSPVRLLPPCSSQRRRSRACDRRRERVGSDQRPSTPLIQSGERPRRGVLQKADTVGASQRAVPGCARMRLQTRWPGVCRIGLSIGPRNKEFTQPEHVKRANHISDVVARLDCGASLPRWTAAELRGRLRPIGRASPPALGNDTWGQSRMVPARHCRAHGRRAASSSLSVRHRFGQAASR